MPSPTAAASSSASTRPRAWCGPARVTSGSLEHLLATQARIRWVQLPWAGVEQFVHLIDDDRVWTCGKGVYAEPVAELALTLALAGMRGLGTYARADRVGDARRARTCWARRSRSSAAAASPSRCCACSNPFDCHITVVRNHVQPMDGADVVIESDRLTDALPGADLVVVALALTPGHRGHHQRQRARADGVARVARERRPGPPHRHRRPRHRPAGRRRSAAPASTSPTPSRCPTATRSGRSPNCIITPHVGNTPDMARPLLAERITQNVRRYAHGEELIGLVDPELGY